MNPYTGDLRLVAEGESLPAGMKLLPSALQAMAAAELSGRTEARVELRKRGPLQDWAKKKRKAKAAAQSRRRNRA